MLKVRITFIDDSKGRKEKDSLIANIKEVHNIINVSRVYKGRGSSKYSNVYLDIVEK